MAGIEEEFPGLLEQDQKLRFALMVLLFLYCIRARPCAEGTPAKRGQPRLMCARGCFLFRDFW